MSTLRGKIQGHSLSELLTSVLHKTSPLGSTLVPALDEHFLPGADHSVPAASCKRGDVIQVQGPAASGKTHFLYYMLINCILPSSYSSVRLHGWGKAAVCLDADHKFDVQRFRRLLSSRLHRLLPQDAPAVEAITTNSLELLHIFRPSSLHQLATTIQHLPIYLATNLPEADLGVLAIDSIDAFYWSDRYALEQLRSGASRRSPSRSQNHLYHVSASIQSFGQSHGPLILLSSWDLNSNPALDNGQRSNAPAPAPRLETYKPGLPPITHHVSFAPSTFPSNPQLGSNSSYILGTVRTPGNSESANFTLHITQDDILTF